MLKQNMIRISSVHQVNNTPSLKNYTTMFDKSKARKMFKDSYPYVIFAREDENSRGEDRGREENRTRDERE
mgnify:FL=1